jgi:hypothetical protein
LLIRRTSTNQSAAFQTITVPESDFAIWTTSHSKWMLGVGVFLGSLTSKEGHSAQAGQVTVLLSFDGICAGHATQWTFSLLIVHIAQLVVS